MPDDLLRAALARSIAVRLPMWNEDELRALDVVALTFEAIRHGDGRDWLRLRRLATGPGDIDDDFHLSRRLRATVATACGGSWPIDDAVELSPNPPLVERCHACWRAAAASSPGGPALGEALLVVVAEMAERDQERASLREAARVEMLGDPACPGPDCLMCNGAACNLCGAGCWNNSAPHCDHGTDERHRELASAAEFSPDQHQTRLDSTSAVIALAEIPRDRDEEIEVDIETEWDLSDVGGGA